MIQRFDWRPLPSDKQGLSVQGVEQAAREAGRLTSYTGSVLYVRVGGKWVQFMVLYGQVVYRTVPPGVAQSTSTSIPPSPTFTCSSCGRLKRMDKWGTLVSTGLGSYILCKDCEDVGTYAIRKSGVRHSLRP